MWLPRVGIKYFSATEEFLSPFESNNREFAVLPGEAVI